jgi:hypothetical protein
MFRFTIRDVLWLTVLVAVLVAWWVDRERVAKREAWARENFNTYTSLSSDLIGDDLFSVKMVPPPEIPRDSPRGITGKHVIPQEGWQNAPP